MVFGVQDNLGALRSFIPIQPLDEIELQSKLI
jgi:hypothetical protein